MASSRDLVEPFSYIDENGNTQASMRIKGILGESDPDKIQQLIANYLKACADEKTGE
jgi:hypothetical protein